MEKKFHYILENWKMIFHLLFKTKHFGVNNQLWSSQPSVFGSQGLKGLMQVHKNYEMIKIRAFSGFIPLNEAIVLFPKHAKKHGYRPIESVEPMPVKNHHTTQQDMEKKNV